MRRISSLPVSEFCSRSDSFGDEIESTNALRSTVFHKYCETGVWPEGIRSLPPNDVEEIQKWKRPGPLNYTVDGKKLTFEYSTAVKEVRVSLDNDFNFVELPEGILPHDIADKFPNVLCSGTLDIAWDLPELDMVVVSDIKSSVFAVKARCKSLQLHGYGFGYAKHMGRSRYVVDIWDASDGKHYTDDSIVSLDSFEAEEYKGRIIEASKHREGGFVKGSHCSGCWKRDACPAHLVDVPDSKFANIFNGKASEADIREALIAAKSLKDKYEKVKDACESWVQRHGPVRSEDGQKEWTVALRSGRKSLDTKAVAVKLGESNLDGYMKVGEPYQVYDWRNRRE